jgi:hypothetical protein
MEQQQLNNIDLHVGSMLCTFAHSKGKAHSDHMGILGRVRISIDSRLQRGGV